MQNRPDFIIIGAMKCATSTLHKQLVAQPGIFMSEPKEPNFFSDDDNYAQGIEWYQDLFKAAPNHALRGEASTHYTKFPTYPHTLERMTQVLPDLKLIYMVRHPIDRLVSHYIHEWTQRIISTDINRAIDLHSELIDYSRYSMQLKPYLDTFGAENILLVFFERFCAHPQAELARVCQFLDYAQTPQWIEDYDRHASRDKMRKSAWRDFLVDAPVLSAIRQKFVPKQFRTWVRGLWTLQERPEINPQQLEHLQTIFDQDLAVLGSWLKIDLSCENFKSTVTSLEQKGSLTLPNSTLS